MANSTYPAEFLSDNLRIQLNVIDACAKAPRADGCSSWVQAASTPSSLRSRSARTALLTGPLEETNDAYAIAKIAGILHIQAIRREDGLPLHLRDADEPVRPGRQLRSRDQPRAAGHDPPVPRGRSSPAPVVTAGAPVRRAASSSTSTIWPAPACSSSSTTTSRGRSTSASGRTSRSASSPRAGRGAVGYEGEQAWDTAKPDGTPQKLLNVERLKRLGWGTSTELAAGCKRVYEDWQRTSR